MPLNLIKSPQEHKSTWNDKPKIYNNMRVYQTNEIKNIALLGSAGSGKTTLAEAMLYESGVIKRRGTIEAKNTVCDYFPVEQEYGYSVFSTVFKDRKSVV